MLGKLGRTLAISGLGLAILAGAGGASAQSQSEEYREWQAAQRRAQEEYRDYQRTRSSRDYRDWQQAQRQAQMRLVAERADQDAGQPWLALEQQKAAGRERCRQ